jgi:hypothetical protein
MTSNGFAEQAVAARWDGTSWTSTAMPTLDAYPWSVSCPTTTFCMAAGAEPVHGQDSVETWNGTSWTVQDFRTRPGFTSVSCTSATWCTAVGGQTAAQWNGSTWSTGSYATPSTGSVDLQAVSCVGTTCQAVGQSRRTSDNTIVPLVEQGTGATFTIGAAAPLPQAVATQQWTAISCVSTSDCFAVGRGDEPTGPGYPVYDGSTARWDGSAWTTASAPAATTSTNVLSDISCASARSCVAVGKFGPFSGTGGFPARLLENWNGSRLAQQGPIPASYYSEVGTALGGVSCRGRFCMAVGSFTDSFSGGQQAAYSASRNGSVWQEEFGATPSDPKGVLEPTFARVSCVSSTFCMATGSYKRNGGASVPLADVWNGASWAVTPLPAKLPGVTTLTGVACSAATACMAVGGTTALRWNGKSWTKARPPVPKGAAATLRAVSCPASNRCVTIGDYRNASGTTVPFAQIWNGKSWALRMMKTPAGGTVTHMNGLACPSASVCTAVGQFATNSSSSTALVETWNGKRWSLVRLPALPATSELNGISCPSKTRCLAAGDSTTAGVQSVFVLKYS